MVIFISESQLQNLRTDLQKSNKAAYAEGTRKNLKIQWEAFLLFCTYFHLVSLPVSTDTLQLFAQFLSRTFKSSESIKNYINGVKSMHLILGFSVDHINKFILNLSLKGIAKLNPHCIKQAEPMTPEILLISGSHQRRMPRFKSARKAPSFLFTFPKMSRSPK